MTLLRQLREYRLTTAEILYHMPDHPGLLQTFIWQNVDLPPRFPELLKFLKFWERNLDGKVHSVRVANVPIIQSPQIRANTSLLVLH